mgnify:CR=1 FL=1|tara:strand:- start:11 stop:469 length:459 start_codon:yes stop_codon:yes gene_type:complete
MKNILLIISTLIFFNLNTYAAFINITTDYNKTSDCILDKQILKNEVYDYKEFSAEQIKENKYRKININAIKSQQLKINGLSDFFSNPPNGVVYDTQILKDNTILLRVLTTDGTYSESVFINKSTGEMLHEITTSIDTPNQGKEISFFTCDMN